ncbi:glycosyltransferase family 8 protein [Paenibacillus borealis]|uniref:glycosyltransferase family 8 protein n=1 Tax=Paenibacillus borealis TaxID=160799 RepID=UPI000694B04F|nr:glycosyltransferase family 8 protein [Paenibacillus borealis]
MSEIHIVTATNDNYANQLCVMLNSMFINKASDKYVHLYLLYDNLSIKNMNKLDEIAQRYGAAINFILVNRDIFNGFIEKPYITLESYYRIIVPSLIEHVDKVIYLDCDLIIDGDITELWNIELGDYYIGAVEGAYKDRMEILSIPELFGYFNAGVLLINMSKWRENNISEIVLDWIKNNSEKIRHMDQDALNAVLFNKRYILSPVWNYTTGHFENLKLFIDAKIYHFTGPKKPWLTEHPFGGKYFQYSRLHEETNFSTLPDREEILGNERSD